MSAHNNALQEDNQTDVIDGLIAEKVTPFVTIFTPGLDQSATHLSKLLSSHREAILRKVEQRGVVVFRGFTGINPDRFNQIVLNDLLLSSNNAFNLKNLPGFAASWVRKYTESLVGGDYRRYMDKNTVRLGPAENAIQGPHTEGGVRAEKSRYIALCCIEPAPRLGETGLCDFSDTWSRLPSQDQEKYKHASNLYTYTTKRPLRWYDHWILRHSPYHVGPLPSGNAELALPPCPLVVKHPRSGRLCIQPWAFAKNTNAAVHNMAKQVFSQRGDIIKDSTAEELNLHWRLHDANDRPIRWETTDQERLFKTIFDGAHLMQWQQGDIALIDNVKCGHWRMNGEQGNRQLIQIQADHFDAAKHLP